MLVALALAATACAERRIDGNQDEPLGDPGWVHPTCSFCDEHGDFEAVYFAPGSVALSDEAKRILDRQLAGLLDMQDYYRNAVRPPPYLVTVEGHTDNREGKSRHGSLELGERRAAVVRAHFISKGMFARNIRTISFGRERPIAVGSDEASLARNRRTSSYLY